MPFCLKMKKTKIENFNDPSRFKITTVPNNRRVEIQTKISKPRCQTLSDNHK